MTKNSLREVASVGLHEEEPSERTGLRVNLSSPEVEVWGGRGSEVQGHLWQLVSLRPAWATADSLKTKDVGARYGGASL